jgi:hypothetical protein
MVDIVGSGKFGVVTKFGENAVVKVAHEDDEYVESHIQEQFKQRYLRREKNRGRKIPVVKSFGVTANGKGIVYPRMESSLCDAFLNFYYLKKGGIQNLTEKVKNDMR